jgi:hypothetical protein
MAKEDFCFTYYDGDAARDTTHMNRLERGAYHDIIISQRKFGHLTLDQCKKILGRDFMECWPAIELILKTDAEGKFFVEWLENSVIKAKKHSRKQSENRKGKTKLNQTETKQKPNLNQTKPLGDGDGDVNGDGDEIGIEIKKESSEKLDAALVDLDEALSDIERWTADVIEGNDAYFINMVRTSGHNVNGSLERFARDHLGLVARYKWHDKIDTQQAFRLSLLGHITKELSNTKQPTKGISNEKLNEFKNL